MVFHRGICLTAIYDEAVRNKRMLLEALQKTADCGQFDAVEYYFEGSEEDIEEIREAIHRHRFYSVYLAGYRLKQRKLDLSAREEPIREIAVRECLELLRRACLLQADKVLLLSGPRWENPSREELIRQTAKSIRQLLEGVRDLSGHPPELTLEFFNDKGEPFLAFGRVGLTADLCRTVADPGFGITFDTSHTAQLRAGLIGAFETLRPHTHHVHLANSVSRVPGSPLYGDKHPLFDVQAGDFSEEDIIQWVVQMGNSRSWKDVDLCSFEVIARDDHSPNWYFEQVSGLAGRVWTAAGR